MAFSVSAISKNTFVTLVAGDFDDLVADDFEVRPRSRSLDESEMKAQIAHDAAVQDLTEQSLQRLTIALNSGVLQPSKSPARSVSTEASQTMLPEPILMRKTFADQKRVASNCSLSTMAPDDALSTPPESPKTNLGLRKAWSSGSVCTMVSWADVSEDDEVEFELDIEAGAKAAQKQEAPVVGPPPGQFFAESVVKSEHVQLAPPPGQFTEVSPRHGRTSQEMTHSSVPKSHNMVQIAKSSMNEPPTTLMIRNIPGKYAQTDLMADLNDTGFGNAYDFLYLPIDKGTSNNVGYAFVNFVDPAVAAQCMQSFAGHRFTQLHRSSNKAARISVAHLQGLEKNLAHYEKTAVNVSKQQHRRPVIIASISKMFA
jgi:hypothetical protein